MKSILNLALPACMLAALIGTAPAEASRHNTSTATRTGARSGEMSRLLSDIRADKNAIANELEALAAASGNPLLISWETHAVKLGMVREMMNRIDRNLNRLDSMAANNSSVETAAVARLRSELAPLARQIEAAIRALDDNRLVVRSPAYVRQLNQLARNSRQKHKVLQQWAANFNSASAMSGGD